MSDGATSDLLDTIAALQDGELTNRSTDEDVLQSSTKVIDALALFIERHGMGSQAVVFLHRYFDGQEKRTPHVSQCQAAPMEPRILTLEDAKADPTRMKEFNQVRIWSNEHRAWWGPKASGYFTDIDSAGVYDITAAFATTLHCCPKKKIQFHSAT